jgi:hypothetical protein
MDVERAAWVICITLVLVIFLNAGIFLAFSKRKPDSFSSTFGKAARGMQNPWQREDARLTELSQRIAELQKNPPPQGDAANEPTDEDSHG